MDNADSPTQELRDRAEHYSQLIGKYCCEDVRNTYSIFYVLGERMKKASEAMREILGAKKTIRDYFLEESMPFEKAILETELNGLRINQDEIARVRDEELARQAGALDALNKAVAEKIDEIEEELYQTEVAAKKTPKGKDAVERRSDKYGTAFSWESAKLVGKLFFEKYSVPEALVTRTKKGQYVTSEPALAELGRKLSSDHPIQPVLSLFHEFKKSSKLASTYTGDNERGFVSRMHEGRIYTEYNPFIVTGRLSSVNPNLQNLPRSSPVKRFFRADSDLSVIVHADYSQLEMRVAAHLSQEPTMMEQFRLGLDPHRSLAAKIFQCSEKTITDEQRQRGKTANFALIFDCGPMRLVGEFKDKAGIEISQDEARDIKDAFFNEQYRDYRAYLDKLLEQAYRLQRVIAETGRVRRLPDIIFGAHLRYGKWNGPRELTVELEKRMEANQIKWWPNMEKTIHNAAKIEFNHAKNQAFNFPVQSLGASVCKRAIVALHAAGFKVLATVHDSIDVEIPANRLDLVADIRRIMETTYRLSVPLKTDIKLLKSFDEGDKWEEAKSQQEKPPKKICP